MHQFDKTHFASAQAILQRSMVRRESALDVALRELSLEAARHRLHVAQQRMHEHEYERARQARLHYDDALDRVEKIEREQTHSLG